MTIGDIRNDLKERFVDKPTAERSECLQALLKDAHMDEEQKQKCKANKYNWWTKSTKVVSHRSDFEQLKDLCEIRDRLLAKGGDMARMPSSPDEDTQAILKYGQFWNGIGAKECQGQINQYRANSCRIWAKEKDNLDNNPEFEIHICTGFALSDSGMWREHSWLIEKTKMHQTPIIIETTFPRLLYFGYVLDDYRATALYYHLHDFLCYNLPDPEGFKEPVGYNDYLDYTGYDGFDFPADVDTDGFEIPSEPIQENER